MTAEDFQRSQVEQEKQRQKRQLDLLFGKSKSTAIDEEGSDDSSMYNKDLFEGDIGESSGCYSSIS